jgi:hypothetical protein
LNGLGLIFNPPAGVDGSASVGGTSLLGGLAVGCGSAVVVSEVFIASRRQSCSRLMPSSASVSADFGPRRVGALSRDTLAVPTPSATKGAPMTQYEELDARLYACESLLSAIVKLMPAVLQEGNLITEAMKVAHMNSATPDQTAARRVQRFESMLAELAPVANPRREARD